MNDNYQRIHLAGEKQDSEQIIATLAGIKAGRLKDDLKLLNFYREIPVSYAASVESVEESFAELRVHQVQAVVISDEKVTILKSSHFPRDVIANVSYVNVEKSLIVLSSFCYALVRADRRMSVRVELGEQIRASFTHDGVTAGGTLHDMSLTGLSINLDKDPGIPLSQQGELSVTLPLGTILVPASLLKVVTTPDGSRLVFEIEATRATELSISKYILKRQVEIIRELKDHPGITLD
jgi:hypothetical protein